MSRGLFLPTSSTKALYRLEDVNDSSGNSKTLTNNNSVTFPAGFLGNCADFGTANTNKSLSIADNLGIAGGGNVTLSAWIKMNTEIGSGYQVFLKTENSTTSVAFLLSYDYNAGTRQLIFDRVKTNIASTRVLYTVTLGTSNWHHLVLTYDGTNVRGYLNGKLVGTTAGSGNGSSGLNGTYIGNWGQSTYYASAKVDEAIIENRVWSDNEVSKYYSDIKCRFVNPFN